MQIVFIAAKNTMNNIVLLIALNYIPRQGRYSSRKIMFPIMASTVSPLLNIASVLQILLQYYSSIVV